MVFDRSLFFTPYSQYARLLALKKKLRQLDLADNDIFSELQATIDGMLAKTNKEEHQYDELTQQIENQVEFLIQKYNCFQTLVSLTHFNVPKSYHQMAEKSHDVLDKIVELYTDYATNNFFRFHWGRSHQALAKQIAKEIRDQKNPVKYLQSKFDQLGMTGKLNLQGSFARRTQYCLALLKKAEPKVEPKEMEVEPVDVIIVSPSCQVHA